MFKKKEYVNMDTGELAPGMYRTWWGAYRYFKKDAKKWGYELDKRAVKVYDNSVAIL